MNRKAQPIGIVACSAEGAALCYRTIACEGRGLLGEHAHPEIILHTIPLADYMVGIRAGDWEAVGALMLRSLQVVASAGAAFAICPDNTIHQALPLIRGRSPIPWLHIAEEVAREARKRGFRRIAITGTKYLMTGPVYPDAFAAAGLEHRIPKADQRERIDDIIFSQLVYGDLREESRDYFNRVIGGLRDQGCDAVVLGCTEIPLLVRPDDCPLPTLDSTRLLARAALRASVEGLPGEFTPGSAADTSAG
jgi:aspartate racemase